MVIRDLIDENGWFDSLEGADKTENPLPVYRLILENGISAAAVLDAGCSCVYANGKMAGLAGCLLEDIVGKDFRTFLDPSGEGLLEIESGGKSEAVFKGGDGVARTAEVRVIPFITESGESYRLISAVDITAHRRMGAELAESEKRYRLLVENIEEFFFEQSIEGGFDYFNEAMVRHSGYSREELSVINFKDYVLPEDWDKVVEFYEGILKTGKPASGLLIRGRMKDGSVHYYSVKSNLKTDENGRKTGFRSYCRDVTAEILYEKERLKMHEALEAKVMERTQELHDINTALEVLLKKREDDKRSLEERVAFSIKEFIAPHIELLKKTGLDSRQAVYLEILEQNFNEIFSPFTQTLSDSIRKLTPSEIQVVNLIKQNKSSKEIADFLGVSPRTVEFHRDNIRKKLGIKNKKQNLRSRLLSDR
jgi:PAS domain S-box-containing protein